MAAVLCLIMLPLVASIGFMLGTGGTAGTFAFLVLGAFLLFAAVNLSREWDEEKQM